MMPGYSWILVFLLWMTAVLNFLDRQVIFSLLPPLQNELKLSNTELGLIGTAFLWVYGSLSPLAGFLGDRFGRRKVILLSLIVWSAVTWVTGHVQTLSGLLSVRALMGISQACYLPAALALIADHHSERTRSRACSLHNSGTYFGIVLAGVGGGWMGQAFGWRAVFTLLGAMGIGYAGVLAPGLLPVRGKTPGASRPERLVLQATLKELFGTHLFLVFGCLNAVQSIAWWIVYAWLPLHLFERFHKTLADAGFTATFYVQIASMTGIVAGGWIADRWSRSSERGRQLTGAVGLLIAGPCLSVVGFTNSSVVLATALIFVGIGRGFYDGNLMPIMCQFTRPELRATGYGIYNCFSALLSGTMTAVAGALKSTLGLGGALEIAGVIVLLCGLYILRISSKQAMTP